MAQDGGVDPHSISAAHGFLDRCQRRPTSSCILEVPARVERASTDLQSVALTSLAMEPSGTAPRFRSPSSRVKAECAVITPVRYVVREVRVELTCLSAPGFGPDTYTDSVTRAWCLPRDSNPQSSRRPILSRTCIPVPPRRHSGDPCGI